MGYYTYFTFSVEKKDSSIKNIDIIEKIRENMDANEYFMYPFEDEIEDYDGESPLDFEAEESAKWYDYQDEMRLLSKGLPGVIFKIHGEGEENGDIWDAYFKDGKSAIYHAEVVIPPLDEKDLS